MENNFKDILGMLIAIVAIAFVLQKLTKGKSWTKEQLEKCFECKSIYYSAPELFPEITKK
jgi:hypothetical protein